MDQLQTEPWAPEKYRQPRWTIIGQTRGQSLMLMDTLEAIQFWRVMHDAARLPYADWHSRALLEARNLQRVDDWFASIAPGVQRHAR